MYIHVCVCSVYVYSLRIDNYNIHSHLTAGKETIDVTFEAITVWASSSIEVIKGCTCIFIYSCFSRHFSLIKN